MRVAYLHTMLKITPIDVYNILSYEWKNTNQICTDLAELKRVAWQDIPGTIHPILYHLVEAEIAEHRKLDTKSGMEKDEYRRKPDGKREQVPQPEIGGLEEAVFA